MTEEYIKHVRTMVLLSLYLVSTIMLWLGLSSCGDSLGIEENVRETEQNRHLQPLEEGYSWTYRVTTYNSDGQQTGQEHRFVDITRTHPIDGEIWYRVSTSGDESFDMLLTKRDDGVYRLWPDDVARLFVADPPTIDQQFTFPAEDAPLLTYRRVVALEEERVVEDRSYVCVHLKDTDGDQLSLPEALTWTDNYYARGTGLVSALYYGSSPVDVPYLSQRIDLVQFSKSQE